MTPRDPALSRLRAAQQRHAQTATEGHLEAIAALYDGSPCPGCGSPPAVGSLSCAGCFATMTWRVARAVSDTEWAEKVVEQKAAEAVAQD